jgi:hypothetical protein
MIRFQGKFQCIRDDLRKRMKWDKPNGFYGVLIPV